jgi:hypothetical protein
VRHVSVCVPARWVQGADSLQVAPFLRPVLEYVRQRGSAAARGRAQAGLQVLRSPAVAPSMAAAPLGDGSTSLDLNELTRMSKVLTGQHGEPAPAAGSNGQSKEQGKGRRKGVVEGGLEGGGGQPLVDFNDFLRVSAGLQGRDSMPAYQGVRPVHQNKEGAAVTGAQAATAGVLVGCPLQEVQLALPRIWFDATRMPTEGWVGMREALPGHGGPPPWLSFKLDRARLVEASPGLAALM